MAWCLNCNKRVACTATACPYCKALYGSDNAWRPLPENEDEEAAQQRQMPLWIDAIPAQMPEHWRIKGGEDGLHANHGMSRKESRRALLWILPGMFVGCIVQSALLFHQGEKGIALAIWGLLPLALLGLFVRPSGLELTVFNDGEYIEKNNKKSRALQLGTPVSILVEPFNRAGNYAPPMESPEARLVARGPKGFAVIATGPAQEMKALRDEMRKQRGGA